MEYGADATAEPRLAPSKVNCTLATLTLSAAFALTVTVPLTTAAVGDVIETVGAWLSTATEMVAEAELPAVSLANAVSVWLPLEAVAVFHETE
jgi:hypothetical protein